MLSREVLMSIISLQTRIIAQGSDLNKVMNLLVDHIPDLLDADGAVIELTEDDFMVYRAVSRSSRQNLGLRIPRKGSLSGMAADMNQVLICRDSEEDARVDRIACRAVGLRSMIVVPLAYGGDTVGVLKAFSNKPEHFQARHQSILDLLSETLSAAIFFASHDDRAELIHKATHDYLTDSLNRSEFMRRLRLVHEQRAASGNGYGLMILDLDGLKAVNDQHGHKFGDRLIQEFAARCASVLGEEDLFARIGGDEFALLLGTLEPGRRAFSIISAIRNSIAQPLDCSGVNIPIEVSIGLSVFPRDASSIAVLLEIADMRMYRQKHYYRDASD